jgi:histidyl-tRNA synthetase
MQAIQKLRHDGITVELYPDAIKVGKQFGYADKRNIPFAVIVGESEMKDNQFGFKNLQTGEQLLVDFETLKTLLLA